MEEIGDLGKNLMELINGDDYKFIKEIAEKCTVKPSMRWNDHGKYYEACSIVWIFLEQSNLVDNFKAYKEQSALRTLVLLLSSSRRGDLSV